MNKFTILLLGIVLIFSFTYAQEKTEIKINNQAAEIVEGDIGESIIDLNKGYVHPPSSKKAIMYDNGPLINSPGTGVGGADESVLQSSLLMTTLGAGHQVSAGNRIADEFQVPAGGWQIDSLTFYAYQTGSPTTSSITAVNYQVWDGPPDDPASSIVFGDQTTNRLLSTGWSNVYRVTEATTGTATDRPIMANVCSADFALTVGTYWLDWQTDGSLASGPWAPPITINGQDSTGNALQYTTANGWLPIVDTGSNTAQGFPFLIEGSDLGDPTDPSPPTDFTAYSDYATPTSMLLNWTDPTTLFNGTPMNTSDFTIEVERDGAFVTSVAGGTRQYTDMGLTDGQLYNYEIYAKLIANDSTSSPVNASWTAGGSLVPDGPTALSITDATGGDLNANWTNPSTQTDGTPFDDFTGVYLYENGTLLATFTRTVGDTGVVDTDVFTPTTANAEYWVTVFDNETPINESAASNSAYPPVGVPYLEDFENATVGTPGTLPLLWTNETDDDHDWYVDEGGTVSSATGPTVDHTLGTAAGNYMFTETSGFLNMVCNLTSPTLDISTLSSPGLSFWYHMHGATMGELHVDVYHNGAWVLDAMPALIGQQQAVQTDPWLQAIVDLSPYTSTPIQVRFRAITGTSYTSDMAIDDVHFTSLSGNPTMVVTPQVLVDTLLIGETGMVQFNVSNTQASPTTLNFTVTEDPAVSWLSVLPASGAVTSGNSATIDVNLDATGLAGGPYTTDLIVAGSDTNNTADTVAITLQVNDAPVIGISPTSFSKSLLTNQSTTDTLTISNTGAGVLNFEIMIEDVAKVEVLRADPGSNLNIRPSVTDPEMDKAGSSLEGVLINNIPEGYPRFLNRTESITPDLMWYKFDEAGTTTTQNYAPAGTRVNEFATLMGGMTMGSTGQTGSALIGTGGSSTSDYVDTGWGPDVGTSDWAISLWLNNIDNSTTLYYHFGDINSNSFRCFSGGVAGAGNLMLRGGGLADVIVTGAGPGPVVVDFIYDSAVPEVRAYIDGVLNNTVPQSGVDLTGTGPFKIGGYSSSVGMVAGELMDDFKMWNTIPTFLTWLLPDTMSGTVAAGSSMDIILTFDATGFPGGDYTSNINVTSNDPANPTVMATAQLHVTGVADIGVSTTQMDWGTVYTNVNDTMSLGITNTGTDTLHVTGITNSTSEFTIVGNTVFDLQIGETYDLPITFMSATSGTFNDSLIIVSNAVNPAPTVYMTAITAGPPVISLSDTLLQNQMNEGEEDSTTLTIYNTGASPLDYELVLGDVPFTENELTIVNLTRDPSVTYSNNADVNSNGASKVKSGGYSEALFDLQFNFDATAASGAAGNAGAEFDGTYYYSTRWASNLIHQYDMAGNLVQEFSIAGVTGLRDLAFDGTYFYGGASATTIYIMDFVSQTLVGTIPSPEGVRHIAYDAGMDAFWIGNWATDLYLVDRNGATLSTIPAATHGGANMYGSAYDDYSPGGPYLWLFDQNGATTTTQTPQLLIQLSLPAGTPTGVQYDILNDFVPGTAVTLAGGLFIAEGIVQGKATLGGLAQGTPDLIFCYELAEAASWVTLDHTTGTVAPNDSGSVMVYWHGVITEQVYDGYLGVTSNDPVNPVENVHLSLDVISGIGDFTEALPTKYALHQNFPNPFNPSTTIKYDLKVKTDVMLTIYNVLGQKVRTLVQTNQAAGFKNVVWNGLNEIGEQVATGVYIYRIEADGFVKSRKMVFMK
jgi:MAM domain-containing protein meprin/A5/mu/flagellar hook capping protein FlgD/HYDIN/CFA65/VesB family protein/BACON domain-containing protein